LLKPSKSSVDQKHRHPMVESNVTNLSHFNVLV
jgi:hypothetical protein